jgi:hypothetical protein
MSHVSSNLAEQVIEKGLATVVRHKRDDEDRSPDFDKLMAAEQACEAFTIVWTSSNSLIVQGCKRQARYAFRKGGYHPKTHQRVRGLSVAFPRRISANRYAEPRSCDTISLWLQAAKTGACYCRLRCCWLAVQVREP